MPKTPAKAAYGYGKRPLWQWVVLYLVIGAVVYAAVYYVFFMKRGYGSSAPTGSTQQTQPYSY